MRYYSTKHSMIDYWLNLAPAERTFTGIGVFSSLILTVQMGMVMLGGAVDMPEAEIADTGEGGASGIFSIRTIGAFFAGFGYRSCHVTGWVQHWGSYFCCDPIGFCISWSCHLPHELSA